MTRKRLLLVFAGGLALATVGVALTPAAKLVGNEQPPKTLVQVQKETERSVVFIQAYAKDPKGELSPRSLGSGFVVPVDGKLMVVSNYHVVVGANELWARTAEKTVPPLELSVVGYSPFLDLALLEIKNANPALAPIRLGNSDTLKADDPVIAIGSPLGIPFLAFKGVVTKPDEMLSATTNPSVIISDVKVNPGNSGGPLLTTQSEAVGINTSIAGPNPISFSIPFNHLKAVLPRLKLGGELKHALVGHQRNIRHAFAKEKLRTRIEGYGEQNEWDEFEIHAINFGMMRRHYQWRVAAITMISPARPTPWLTRSRAANTMGSSCMSPRWATNQARLIQYSSTGQSSQSTWGVAYSLRLSGLLM